MLNPKHTQERKSKIINERKGLFFWVALKAKRKPEEHEYLSQIRSDIIESQIDIAFSIRRIYKKR